MARVIIVMMLLFTSCCYGLTSSPEVKSTDRRLRIQCQEQYIFPFKTNLCPVLKQKSNQGEKTEYNQLKKFHKFQTRKLMADEEEEEDDENKGSTSTLLESPLLSFRIIGCGMVTIFVGITIIVYVTTNMFFTDSVAQICSELCLLSAYTGILLITTDSLRVDSNFCKGIAIFLQFAFLAYFTFALIEVICMVRLLFESFPEWIFPSIKSVLFIGWGIPTAITIISAATLHNQYTGRRNCWLNLDKSALWPTVIPIGICCCVQLLMLIAVIVVSKVPYTLSQPQYDRARCFLTTRWASVIILTVAVLAWSTGIVATHRNNEAYFAAFTVSSIFLGAVVLILRISSDAFVRRAVSSNVLSHIIKTSRNNKVTAWSEKVLKAKEVAPNDKKDFDIDHQVVTNGNNHQMVAHR